MFSLTNHKLYASILHRFKKPKQTIKRKEAEMKILPSKKSLSTLNKKLVKGSCLTVLMIGFIGFARQIANEDPYLTGLVILLGLFLVREASK